MTDLQRINVKLQKKINSLHVMLIDDKYMLALKSLKVRPVVYFHYIVIVKLLLDPFRSKRKKKILQKKIFMWQTAKYMRYFFLSLIHCTEI